MSAGLVALAIFLQPAASQGLLGTTRPSECGVSEGVRAANMWERAKEPQLKPYCDLLASGTAKLVTSTANAQSSILVKEVPRIADEADKLLPGRAAPLVLKGRAFLRLGKPEDALGALREAKKRDDRALDDPVALLAWARANARTGKLEEAALAYRAALPRTSGLASHDRAAASFEAATTVMMQGGAGIDDAIAMYRQARRDAQDAMQIASVVGLALALDRAGLREESKAVLAERVREGVKSFLSDPRVAEALGDAGATHEDGALVATALEATDPAGAREAWRKYVEGPGGKGPWGDHARAKLGGRPAVKGAAPPAGGPR